MSSAVAVAGPVDDAKMLDSSYRLANQPVMTDDVKPMSGARVLGILHPASHFLWVYRHLSQPSRYCLTVIPHSANPVARGHDVDVVAQPSLLIRALEDDDDVDEQSTQQTKVQQSNADAPTEIAPTSSSTTVADFDRAFDQISTFVLVDQGRIRIGHQQEPCWVEALDERGIVVWQDAGHGVVGYNNVDIALCDLERGVAEYRNRAVVKDQKEQFECLKRSESEDQDIVGPFRFDHVYPRVASFLIGTPRRCHWIEIGRREGDSFVTAFSGSKKEPTIVWAASVTKEFESISDALIELERHLTANQ